MTVRSSGALRICVLGAGLKGFSFLADIVELGLVPATVISYHQPHDGARGFERMSELCARFQIPFLERRRPSREDLSNADLIFVVGWQYLFSYADLPLVVFHDSLLPAYRGFAPTVTALIEGDTTVGVTALVPNEEIDAGTILAQASFQVGRRARIEHVLNRQAELMATLALDLVERKLKGSLSGVPQNDTGATYSIWRDSDDYKIDWNWDARKIERFVYALGYPYEGARSSLADETMIIRECEALDEDLMFVIRQPGKIWAIVDRCPIVVCGAGMLKISVMSHLNGEQVYPERLRLRFT